MLRVVIPPRPAVVRMARRLCVLCVAGLLYLSGVATGLFLIGWQTRIAVDHLQAWGGRLAALEAQYARDHASSLRTTAGRAAVIVQRQEDRR